MIDQLSRRENASLQSSPEDLLTALQVLRQQVEDEGQQLFSEWRSHIKRPDFLPSALNLAQYLALRRHDLRSLQTALMPWGLSSLGRIEARVMPNLEAVIATLNVICGQAAKHPPLEAFFEGDRLLRQNTEALFGQTLPQRRVRIMVTLPTEAANDYPLAKEIVARGASCIRINCAHDDVAAWQRMIDHTRRAEMETGKGCKVMMDLAGPKIRTGPVLTPAKDHRLFQGDCIVLARSTPNLEGGQEAAWRSPTAHAQTSCTIPEILDYLEVDKLIYIDDGKLRTRVIDPHYTLPNGETALLLQVTHARPKGEKLT